MAEQIERLVTVWDARFDRLEEKLNKAVRATYGAASKMEKRLDAVNDNVASKFKRNLGSEFSRGLDELGSNAGRASGLLSGLGTAGVVAAAGLGAVVAALAQAKAAVAFGDAIADSAQKIGVSTDTLQEYRYAIHQLGGEYTDADAALSKFTQTFGKATTLGGKALKAFQALEIDPQKFHDAEDALQAVLDKLARIPEEAKRQALAKALGLEEFIPLAREGTTKLDELREAARNLGFVMDKDLIARAGEVNDKLEDLQQVVSVQLASAFVELAPYILKVAEAMVKGAQFAHDFAATLQDVKNWADSLGLSPLARWFDELLQHLDPVRIALREIQNALRVIQGSKASPSGQGLHAIPDKPAKPVVPFNPKAPSSSGGGGKKSAPRDDIEQRTQEVNATLASAGKELYQAMLDLTSNIEDRAAIEKHIADQENKAAQARLDKQIADLRDDKAFDASAAKKAEREALIAKLEIAKQNQQEAADAKQAATDRDAAYKLEDGQIEVHTAIVNALIDQLQAEADIATTAAQRDKIEKQILDLRQQLARDLEGTSIDRRVAKGEITPKDAAKLKVAQGVTQEAEQTRLANDQKNPWQKYIDSIKDVDTAFQEMEVNGVQSLIDGLSAAAVGAANLGDVFRQTIQQMAIDANRILLQSLLGGATGGSGGFLSGLFKTGGSLFGGGIPGRNIDISALAGLYASGTNYAKGGLSLVGENGPELLNIPRGAQVIPNDILRSMARSRAGSVSNSRTWSPTIHLTVVAGPGADRRETARQAHAGTMRALAVAKRQGY